MDPNIWYSKNQCPQTPEEAAEMCHIPYHKAVGSLLYLAVTTHPDIAFPIGILSQFVDNPEQVHWEGVKHAFWYLASMRDWVLVYGMKVKDLEGFTDADSAMWEHRHAIMGYTFLGETFPGLPRKKKLSCFPPPNQNMWPLHMLPRRPYGFTDLLVRYSNCSPTQYHFIQTRKPLSHLPATGLIMPVPNTLTYGIILFDSS